MPASRNFLIVSSTLLWRLSSQDRPGSGQAAFSLPSRNDVVSDHPRADAVDQYGQDDDHAHQRLLPVGADLGEHEAVADHLEQHAADDGAEWTTDAAGEIGTADDGRSDHVELVGRRHVGRRRSEPARDDGALEAYGERAERIDLDLHPPDRDTGEVGRLLFAAEREHATAE